jgi:hypothetical protein
MGRLTYKRVPVRKLGPYMAIEKLAEPDATNNETDMPDGGGLGRLLA